MKKLLIAFCLLATAGMAQMKLLETETSTGATTLNLTSWYSTAYDDYQIEVVSLVPVANNVTPCINFSSNGGSTYDVSANYDNSGMYDFGGNLGAWANTGATCWMAFGGNLGNAGGYENHATFKLKNPAGTTNKMPFGTQLQLNAAVNWPLVMTSYCIYHTTSAVNAFQVSIQGGTGFYGTVRVYGLAK